MYHDGPKRQRGGGEFLFCDDPERRKSDRRTIKAHGVCLLLHFDSRRFSNQ